MSSSDAIFEIFFCVFPVYVNDINESLLSVVRLSANDMSLACTTSNKADLQSILNHDLDIITKWSKQWLVTFNYCG